MEYLGTIRSGKVVLENGSGAGLPDGTKVRVTPIETPALSNVEGTQPQTARDAGDAPPAAGTLGERLMKFAGCLKGLPRDLARNHDHYIHGTPRE